MTELNPRNSRFKDRRLNTGAACALIVAATLAAPTLRAQTSFDSVRTATGFCRLWQTPPGTSTFPRDASYRRCALERAPRLLSAPAIPAPWLSAYAGGSILVVVNPDGTVDPALTRAYTVISDTTFNRRVLEAIHTWRFEPGIREDKPVRSAFQLQIASGFRPDTIPSRLEWRYASGTEDDSLVGRWIAMPQLPSFMDEQVDSVHAALLRLLVRRQIVVPSIGHTYCLVAPSADSSAHERAMRYARTVVPDVGHFSGLTPFGCERTPGPHRIFLAKVYRTENDRAVLLPAGDYLPNWPVDLNGRSWRAWQARCVAKVPESASSTVADIECDISPAFQPDESAAMASRMNVGRQPSGKYIDGDSVRVTVVALTRGSYLIDTLRRVVRNIPRLDSVAIRDSRPPCGSWTAYSTQDFTNLLVVFGDPTGRNLQVTTPAKGSPPAERWSALSCGPQEPRMSEFAAFFLGGIGDPPTSPTTLCFSNCARAYVLDPVRHKVADAAHVIFRLSDLRPDARLGDQLTFRLIVEPAPDALIPVVVVVPPNGGRTSVWLPGSVGPNTWDFNVNRGGGYSIDTGVYIYLIAR